MKKMMCPICGKKYYRTSDYDPISNLICPNQSSGCVICHLKADTINSSLSDLEKSSIIFVMKNRCLKWIKTEDGYKGVLVVKIGEYTGESAYLDLITQEIYGESEIFSDIPEDEYNRFFETERNYRLSKNVDPHMVINEAKKYDRVVKKVDVYRCEKAGKKLLKKMPIEEFSAIWEDERLTYIVLFLYGLHATL